MKNTHFINEDPQLRELIGELATQDRSEKLRRRVHTALNSELTEKQKQAVIHYYYDGWTMEQIARYNNVNKSTVSRTLSRAKIRLKRCLKYGAYELLDKEE